jgi:hypothetical protein
MPVKNLLTLGPAQGASKNFAAACEVAHALCENLAALPIEVGEIRIGLPPSRSSDRACLTSALLNEERFD